MKAVTVTMYMRFEIASVSPSRHALSTCGTKLGVERTPATTPRAFGSQPSIRRSLQAGPVAALAL
ncbi:MAG: hypothetical protein AVDCRST_MAG90-2656 [uncultured Microvirga sp.]|uniref:Uncharacterized protein n=1 Tax=uncultured Microvirga sp. TaxID=412392 RepID=A0A6J4MHV0_9HYPH|nr:MAG: hypothetical protein AVDCRST_MAG90-2656 [uncultured Microvirga sp.]